MRQFFSSLFLLFLLFSCISSDPDLIHGVKLDRSDDLLGVDSNQSGVRDDIEAIISKLELTKPEKQAALQEARTFQSILGTNLNNQDELRKSREETMRSTVCTSKRFKDYGKKDETVKLIRSITFNTKSRTMHYIKFNKAQSGSVTRLIKEGACDENE